MVAHRTQGQEGQWGLKGTRRTLTPTFKGRRIWLAQLGSGVSIDPISMARAESSSKPVLLAVGLSLDGLLQCRLSYLWGNHWEDASAAWSAGWPQKQACALSYSPALAHPSREWILVVEGGWSWEKRPAVNCWWASIPKGLWLWSLPQTARVGP